MSDARLSGPAEEGKTANIIYILYLAAVIFGLTAIIGVIMAYINKNEAPAWVASHYQFSDPDLLDRIAFFRGRHCHVGHSGGLAGSALHLGLVDRALRQGHEDALQRCRAPRSHELDVRVNQTSAPLYFSFLARPFSANSAMTAKAVRRPMASPPSGRPGRLRVFQAIRSM